MRLPRKWVLSMALLATAPAMTWAGPVESSDTAAAPAAASNQEMATKIASALKAAKLKGKGVKLEYKDGVCTITGQVGDPRQQALATQVIQGVPGVSSCDNQLQVVGARPMPAVANAGFEGAPRQPVQRVNHEAAAPSGNQAVAQQIADSLSASGLSKFDIEVRFKNGAAMLAGKVDSPAAAQKAEEACYAVDGVQNVVNRLAYPGHPNGAARPGVTPAGYPQQMPQGYPQQMAMAQQGMPPQMAMAQPGMGGPGGPMPMMAPPGPGGPVSPAGHMVYNQPNVPQYAWPSYAPYDNSAAVTYPSMYDASAFPYIGPYYPYPQVPLGWRKSTLEWDDGYWHLSFNSRTDRWWWFLNPHNWHE